MTTKEMNFTNMNIKDFIDYIITFDYIVDILEREELNAEWQYVRFSPYRDTNVSGWVKKIYLQYL